MLRRAAYALVLAAALLLGGCAHRTPRYFAYMDAPSSASLEGQLGEVDFTALLRSSGRSAPAGSTLPTACDFTLTYLSPAALAGICIDYTAATGELSVSLGELSAEGDAYTALAAPALLLLTESPVQTTAKNADGSLSFVTTDGTRRLLSPSGEPLSLSHTSNGRQVVLHVKWNANY